MTFRYAICNETFGDWPHERVCDFVAEVGYTGLEVAPFTLAPRIGDVTASQRSALRATAERAGLRIIGLHWLLAKTEGYQVTSPDPAVRRHSAEYLSECIEATAELGGELLVFGSPKQRAVPAGHTLDQAGDFAADTFGQLIPALERTGMQFCLEPLAPAETDFLTTCAEAGRMLDRLGHPGFRLHLDVKAMSSEPTPIPQLIAEFAGRTGHFHANDANLRGPGFGATDFVPIWRALADSPYRGWVSVEVFDYSPDPQTIARESLKHMRACEPKG